MSPEKPQAEESSECVDDVTSTEAAEGQAAEEAEGQSAEESEGQAAEESEGQSAEEAEGQSAEEAEGQATEPPEQIAEDGTCEEQASLNDQGGEVEPAAEESVDQRHGDEGMQPQTNDEHALNECASDHLNGDAQTTEQPQDDILRFFVGGLTPETTQAQLLEYLSKFGCVSNVDLKMDPTTGRNRGYAFVGFRQTLAFSKEILLEGKHTINDKKIDIRPFQDPSTEKFGIKRKVFIGGINPTITEETLRAYFETFGAIDKVSIIKDPASGRSRGFGFVEFETDAAAAETLQVPSHELDAENKIEVRAAEQRSSSRRGMRGSPYSGPPMSAGRGGMYTGRHPQGLGVYRGGGFGQYQPMGGYGGGYGRGYANQGVGMYGQQGYGNQGMGMYGQGYGAGGRGGFPQGGGYPQGPGMYAQGGYPANQPQGYGAVRRTGGPYGSPAVPRGGRVPY